MKSLSSFKWRGIGVVIISAVANDNSQKTSYCAEKAIDYSFENSFKTLLPSGCAKITDHSTQRAAWLLTKQWINQSVRHSNRDVCYAKHCPQKQMIWKNLRAGRSTSWNIHCVHPRLPWDVLIRHVRHSTCAASSPKLNNTEFYYQLQVIYVLCGWFKTTSFRGGSKTSTARQLRRSSCR